MIYRYSLTLRQARICRLAAGLFLAIAVIQVATLLFAIAAPNTSLRWNCGAAGCTAAAVPDLALTVEQLAAGAQRRARKAAGRTAGPTRRRLAHGSHARWQGHSRQLFRGAALWRLSDAATTIFAGVPWLFRASVCTLLYAIVPPPVGIGRTSLLVSSIGPEFVFLAEVDLKALFMNLLLASVAFTVTWAIASGNRAQRDIAEIV